MVTGAGRVGFHPILPLDLTKETRGDEVEFLAGDGHVQLLCRRKRSKSDSIGS